MNKYIKPEIKVNYIILNHEITNSLSGAFNQNFVEDTNVVIEWNDFMNN